MQDLYDIFFYKESLKWFLKRNMNAHLTACLGQNHLTDKLALLNKNKWIQSITVGLLDTFFNIDNNNECFFSTKSAY